MGEIVTAGLVMMICKIAYKKEKKKNRLNPKEKKKMKTSGGKKGKKTPASEPGQAMKQFRERSRAPS
jgi:hypothetical protein